MQLALQSLLLALLMSMTSPRRCRCSLPHRYPKGDSQEERIVDSEFIDRARRKWFSWAEEAHPKRTITDEIGLFEIHEVKCTIDTESKLSFDFVVGHADMVPVGINDFEGARTVNASWPLP